VPLEDRHAEGAFVSLAFEELANSSFVFSKLQPSLFRNLYGKAIGPGSEFLFRMGPAKRAMCF
jgi:hypothetical protein